MLLAASERMPGEDIAVMLLDASRRLPGEDIAVTLAGAGDRMPGEDIAVTLANAAEKMPGEAEAFMLWEAATKLSDLDTRISDLDRAADRIRAVVDEASVTMIEIEDAPGTDNPWAWFGAGAITVVVGMLIVTVIAAWIAHRG